MSKLSNPSLPSDIEIPISATFFVLGGRVFDPVWKLSDWSNIGEAVADGDRLTVTVLQSAHAEKQQPANDRRGKRQKQEE